jgi:hypothetical protein
MWVKPRFINLYFLSFFFPALLGAIMENILGLVALACGLIVGPQNSPWCLHRRAWAVLKFLEASAPAGLMNELQTQMFIWPA